MARPIKNGVDYFPHDSHASDGRTLTILFNHFGHDGISAWWQLLERVSGAETHIIDIRNPENLEFVASKLRFHPDRLKEILQKLADLNAIDPILYRHGIIWIQNLVDRIEDVYKKRKQNLPSKPELPLPETELSLPKTELSLPVSTQSKVNKSKVNKINNSELFETFWKIYPKKIAKPVALKAFNKIEFKNGLFEEMITALKKYKQTDQWSKDEGKYIPHASTWLNQRRWEDEIEVTNNGNIQKRGNAGNRPAGAFSDLEEDE